MRPRADRCRARFARCRLLQTVRLTLKVPGLASPHKGKSAFRWPRVGRSSRRTEHESQLAAQLDARSVRSGRVVDEVLSRASRETSIAARAEVLPVVGERFRWLVLEVDCPEVDEIESAPDCALLHLLKLSRRHLS